MPPDKVFIDENWLKTAPRPPKTSLKDKDYNKRVHHIRDSSLGGFGEEFQLQEHFLEVLK